MGLFRRGRKAAKPTRLEVVLYEGEVPLEVVGESFYQTALEALAGGRGEESASVPVIAVLVPEPDNPYDPNAVAVHVRGLLVGRLSREKAKQYHRAIVELEAEEGKPIALEGTIVGGWSKADGDEGYFGISLRHDPADFH